MDLTRRSKPVEAVGRKGYLRPHTGGAGCRERHAQDDSDRRDLPKSMPYGIEPAGSRGGLRPLIGRTKEGMNTKPHAVTDAEGRPLNFFMTAG